MARPRRDGLPPSTPRKHKLTDSYVRGLLPEVRAYLVWDLRTPGLVIAVYPTATKSWKVIYPYRGKSRW